MSCLIAFILLLTAGVVKSWSRVDETGATVLFQNTPFPGSLGGWEVVGSIPMRPVIHDMLCYDAYQWHACVKDDEMADLLVLYGHRKRTFHLPDSCLAGAGIIIKGRHMVVLTMPDGSMVPFHSLILQDGEDMRVALYTFVGSDGRPTDLLGLNIDMIALRMRGLSPKGAAIRVIGPMDVDKPLSRQSVCTLAAAALKEVGRRVRAADNSVSSSATSEARCTRATASGT